MQPIEVEPRGKIDARFDGTVWTVRANQLAQEKRPNVLDGEGSYIIIFKYLDALERKV